MRLIFLLLSTTCATGVLASDKRELGAHEHGVGALNIAMEGETVLMELRVPGADIVGFEHVAKSDKDRQAIDAAVATLAQPLRLFEFPQAANCSVSEVRANLKSDVDNSEHDHEEHAHEDHDHDHDHAEDEHAHDDHEHSKDDHGHDHAEDAHGHEEHDHDDHAAEEGGHSEFHADYSLTCANPDEITQIDFAYFDTFENARVLTLQVVASQGAQAFKVERASPTLDLRSLF